MVFSPGFDFLTSSACNGLRCHQPRPFVTRHQPSPAGRGRIRAAFSKREFIKGKPFTQLLPFFAPFLSRRVNTSLVEAFVIQNVFSLLSGQLEGRFGPTMSQSQVWNVLPSTPLIMQSERKVVETFVISRLQHPKDAFTLRILATGPSSSSIIREGEAKSND